MEDRLPADAPMFPFWNNLECRPCDWIDDWEHRPPGVFHENAWYRFRPTPTFADPFLDAGRALLVLDTVLWPVAARGHPGATTGTRRASTCRPGSTPTAPTTSSS